MSSVSVSPQHLAHPPAVRRFGRFALRQLLGRSQRTMLWLADDPRYGHEMLLSLPRVAPADAAALDDWLAEARHGARLSHPHLAAVVEVGAHEHWPYLACDRALGRTLGECLAAPQVRNHNELAGWLCQALQGLAFAHEAGLSHGDVQLHNLLVDERGHVRLMALGAAGQGVGAARAGSLPQSRGLSMDPLRLRAQRAAAEHDVLAFGVLAHRLVAGESPLDEPDIARVIDRLAPLGREVLRLPWSTSQPVAEGLRAIVNRATHHQPRQRYLNARSLLRALDGWRVADAEDSAGPIGLLLERLASVGHLPAMPGVADTVARLARAGQQHTRVLAEHVLLDLGLAFELLRQVNTAQVRMTQAAGNGPVLTVRRAIAMLGLDGVHTAVTGLRAWPGPLAESAAAALQRLIGQVRLAGHLAQQIRPAGYDPEVVFLLAALQNLGRLMLHYHFAEDAEQIAQLMRAAPAALPEAAEPAGMSEQAAAFAVLGTDAEAMAAAVAMHWGLADEVLQMIRRLPTDRPVRTPDSDADVLRATASAANEAVDALVQQAPARQPLALEAVAKRYARVLGLNARDLDEALREARHALESGATPGAGERPVEIEDEPLAARGTS
jgi:eukaryotic-like serine/threonine-protein kinase